MTNNIRLSRISHPRATLFGFTLLIAVFVLFGIWAQIFHPEWMAVSGQPSITTQIASASGPWLQDLMVLISWPN